MSKNNSTNKTTNFLIHLLNETYKSDITKLKLNTQIAKYKSRLELKLNVYF